MFYMWKLSRVVALAMDPLRPTPRWLRLRRELKKLATLNSPAKLCLSSTGRAITWTHDQTGPQARIHVGLVPPEQSSALSISNSFRTRDWSGSICSVTGCLDSVY